MKLCEDCQHRDVCKFRKQVEKYKIEDEGLPEPLFPFLQCKYNLPMMVSCPGVWTYGTYSTPSVTYTE